MSEVINRYCYFATQVTSALKDGTDLLAAKVRTVYDDGTEKSQLKLIHSMPRKFYVTKKALRTHKTKKEYETLANLDEYVTRDSQLSKAVARALGMHGGFHQLSELLNSPYVYGADISTESLFKYELQKRYNKGAPDAHVAALDYETNVHSEREEIISGSVTFKDKVIIAFSKDYIGQTPDVENRLQEAFEKHLGKYKSERNISLDVVFCRNDLDVVTTLINKLHEWSPDFVSVWNLPFDMGKMIETCEYYGIEPKDIFSDPSIPKAYRYFNWRPGQQQKTTASGKVTSKHYADLWHICKTPASFYFIDSMCFFKKKRVMEAARNSYSLDAILTEELNLTKLQVPGTEQFGDNHGLEWHRFMQQHRKIDYLVYNIFDCIALELLDEKTKDLSRALSASVGVSRVEDINSPPRNLANNLHFYLQEQGKIICSTGTTMKEEYDDLTMSMRGWILTLSSDLNDAKGYKLIDDCASLVSRLYTQIFDIDIASGYPTTGCIMNVSKETTLVEVFKMLGLPESELRRIGVNLTALRNNAVDIGSKALNLPDFDAIRESYV